MMGFETLTLAPIDRRLIVKEMLAPDEIAWLDAYHAKRPRSAVTSAGGRRPHAGWRRQPGRWGE